MTIEQIRELADNIRFDGCYEYVGIRTQEQPFTLGRIDHCSHVWVDGDETDEELDGISCTNVTSDGIKMHMHGGHRDYGFYLGDHVALIAGNECEYGEDLGELIIRDAEVVHIIK